MSNVLILGNERLIKDEYNFLYHWNEDIWGFNLIFLNNDTRIKKVFVDNHYLFKALEHKTEFGREFDIFEAIPDSCLSALAVRCAIENEYDNIYICGLSLGDTKHEIRNKANWIRDWNILNNRFGLDAITFIRKDYKKTIRDNKDIKLYGEETLKDFSNSVLILGNGTTRKEEPDITFIRNWKGELWGCNGAYTEDLPFMRVGALDKLMLQEIKRYKAKYNKSYIVFSKRGDNIFQYSNRKGNTGYLWILQALHEGFKKIYLSGFDFGGHDLYTGYKSGVSFRKRFKEIVDEFGLDKIYFLRGYPDFLT